MKYPQLIFDLDNTLLDFTAGEQQALEECFRQFFPQEMLEELIESYHVINRRLWKELEEGKRKDPSEFNQIRFAELARNYRFDADSQDIAREYRNCLARQAQHMPNALELLKKLDQRGYKLSILTNGIKNIQDGRFKLSGFGPHISQRVCSEEIGFSKPDVRAFHALFTLLEEPLMEDILIIGDSLKSDIQGGINAGIATCWFNPHGLDNDSGITPDHEIGELKELLRILEG